MPEQKQMINDDGITRLIDLIENLKEQSENSMNEEAFNMLDKVHLEVIANLKLAP